MSEFSVPVVRIGDVVKHPNADALSTVVVEGETVIIRTGDFVKGDFAIYVPVDAIVPVTVPGTEFLGEHRRIKAKRLRGVYSEGLLLPMSALGNVTYFEEGSDAAELLNITKHEDKVPVSMGGGGGSINSGGEQESPRQDTPIYDIENGKKYNYIMVEGEEVVITEKLHGTNARYAFIDGRLRVGSRNHFWKDPNRSFTWRERWSSWVFKLNHKWGVPLHRPKENVYWRVARELNLAEGLSAYPQLVIYGEVFGDVQDLKYGHKQGEVSFRVFDIYDRQGGFWLPWDAVHAVCDSIHLEVVPKLYRGPYSLEKVESLVEGNTTIGKHIREGVVVKPAYPRNASHFGRVILKWVAQGYKLRKGGTELH